MKSAVTKAVEKASVARRQAIDAQHDALRPPWVRRIVGWLRQMATTIEDTPFAAVKRGLLVEFRANGTNLGYPVYSVYSVRGGFYLGRLEWSNQWRSARFQPAADAVFDSRCLGEIYAMCKEFK